MLNRFLVWFFGWIFGFLFWAVVVFYLALVTSLTNPVNLVNYVQTVLMFGPILGLFGSLVFDVMLYENKNK